MAAAIESPITMSKIGLTKRRKIYATSEERKQRNRQAQAAFRERRTEYIKQLESTIKHHEDTLQNLQNSHRNAADECLMLRYKNSLLERILLEKGSPNLIKRLSITLHTLTSCSTRHRRPGRAARKDWQSKPGADQSPSICTHLAQPGPSPTTCYIEQTATEAIPPRPAQG
jgi:hypothetical protein